MNTFRFFRLSILAVVFCLAGGLVQADMVVVVSAKSGVSTLSADQVAQIFLGKISSIPGGGTASPIDLPEGTALRNEFYSKVTGKDAAQVKAYWSKQIFTGKGQPPREAPGHVEVKKIIAADLNAIGYIDKSAVDSSLKVVLAL